MKKIYTLIASALLTVSAIAAPVKLQDIPAVKVSDQAMARSQMRLDQMANDILNNREIPGLQEQRVVIDGIDYTAYFLNHGKATKVAKGWAWSERLYDVDFIVLSTDSPVSEYYAFSVLWPTQTIINLFKSESSNEGDFEVDNRMLTPAELFEYNKDFVPFKFIYDNPGYVNIAAFSEDDYVTGWYMYAAGGMKGGNSIKGVNKGASLTVNALNLTQNEETGDITMKADILNAAYNADGANQVIGTIDIRYAGGFSWVENDPKHNDFEFSQVHIAYTGNYHGANKTLNIKSNWPYYDQYFPDMKRFYINMCNENMTYVADQWSGTTYPHYHANTGLGLGSENNPRGVNDDPDANYAFVQGSLWAPADKNTFYYLDYTQVESDIEYPRVLSKPEPYTTQEAWANAFEFAILDGMTGAWQSRYTDWYEVELSIGGVDGLVFKAKDTYGNTYRGTFSKGKILYHGDPEDLGKYEPMDVVRADQVASLINDATMVSASNGMIRVVCDGTQNVTIYNVAGAMLNNTVVNGNGEFAATPGVYVVKVGEKSYKVML